MEILKKNGIKPLEIKSGVTVYEIRKTDSIYGAICIQILNLCKKIFSSQMTFGRIFQVDFQLSNDAILIYFGVDNGKF